MNTDDLDQIARLFRLRESGALTQAEFEAEKARVLGGSYEEPVRASVPVQPPEPELIAHAGEHGEEGETKGKRFIVLAAILVVVIVAAIAAWSWLARAPAPTDTMVDANSSASAPTSDTIAGSEVAAAPATRSPATATPSPTPAAEAAYPGSEWFVLDQGADLSANFGPPEAESHYSFECHADRKTISFVSWGADASSGNMATVEVPGADPFAGNVDFSNDGMGSGTIAVPADSAIYTELINGKSPLRVKWNKGAIDEMPNAPKLQDFLKLCRQHSGI